jgi:excisionase family DNA binding protein
LYYILYLTCIPYCHTTILRIEVDVQYYLVTERSMEKENETAKQARRVVTVGEAAAILRISRGAAYQAAKAKELPTIRIGRRLLVPIAALERLLSGNVAAGF